MIQNNLENEIYSTISKTGKNVNLIVMHPETWQKLCEESGLNESIGIIEYGAPLKYKGIVVLRSLDIVDGLFEIR